MSKYTIVKADIDNDKNDIKGVIDRNLGEHSQDWYEWKYTQCLGDHKSCFIARDESKGSTAVGTVSLFPRFMRHEGKDIKVAIAGDIAVDKAHRAFGPALKLEKTVLEDAKNNGVNFVICLPNKAAEALMLRVGYQKIGTMGRFVKLLRTEYKLKKIIKITVLRKIAAAVLDFFIAIFSKERAFINKSGLKAELISSFDAGFDELWQNAEYPFKLVERRSSQFLNWRYQPAAGKYKIFSLSNKDNKKIGYVVFLIENNVFHIFDMFALDYDVSVKKLLAEFISFVRKEKGDAVSVSCFGSPRIKEKLKSFSFVKRDEAGMSILMYCLDDSFKSLVSNEENWYFFMGDNDV
ncbi:MAG: GNAT family N-acetyltransferase [PVC group bacterium]|nr:GNAT family N-acetyltransferase [PVC group bacterium]